MMKTTARNLALTLLTLFIAGSISVHAAPSARIIARYIGPVTFARANMLQSVGTPDSVAYTYSGNRAVYDLATTYALDTVGHTSQVIAYDRYTYTAADSLLTHVEQTVNNGVATNSARQSRAYDAAGNDTLDLSESWDVAGPAWIPFYRTIYSYNAARQRTGLLQQSWNATAGAWTNLNLFAYQYDAAGRDSATVQQKWIAATSNWKNVTQKITRYTSFNKIAAVSSLRWSDTSAVWKDSTGIINHYNSSNYLVSVVNGPIYYSNSAAQLDSAAYTSLDAAGNPFVIIYYQGKISGTMVAWLPDLRYTYTYNSANQVLSNQLELIDKNYVAYNSLTGFNAYNSAGQPTIDEQVSTATGYSLLKTHYRSYYESATAVPNPSGFAASRLIVYPSPATDLVTVSIGTEIKGNIEAALVDATGKILQQWNEPARANHYWQFSVAEFPAGMYFIRLSGSGFTGSRMLTVQH